jgi:hypothetical protein
MIIAIVGTDPPPAGLDQVATHRGSPYVPRDRRKILTIRLVGAHWPIASVTQPATERSSTARMEPAHRGPV